MNWLKLQNKEYKKWAVHNCDSPFLIIGLNNIANSK